MRSSGAEASSERMYKSDGSTVLKISSLPLKVRHKTDDRLGDSIYLDLTIPIRKSPTCLTLFTICS